MVNGALRAGLAVAIAAASLAFPDDAPAQTRRTANQAERERAAATREAAQARTQARGAQTEIAALDGRLADAAGRLAEAEAAALAASARLADLEGKAQLGAAAYRRDREHIETLVIAALFAERQTPGRTGAAQAAALVRASGPAFAQRSVARARMLSDNHRYQADIAAERVLLADAQTAIEAEQQGVQDLLAARRTARTLMLANANEAEQRARRFAAEARTLQQLARRVQPARQQNASARAPAQPLGTLQAPVAGSLALGYGQRGPSGHAATGLTYRTAPGANVSAPASGTVGYAGLFRSYGQILILNLDNGYVLVLAGLENVSARVGQPVLAGQTVGRMPQSAIPAPELYVEVRRDGQPIDPSRQFASRALPPARDRAG